MGDDGDMSTPDLAPRRTFSGIVAVWVLAAVAGVLIGLFTGFPYAVAGAIVLLAALRAWIRGTRDEISRLPREQRLTSAVLPAVPLRQRER